MGHNYLLSIVVPTKDRYKYLISLIDLIKSFHTDEIELVIQDNTYDNTPIKGFLSNLDYPHCKYFHESSSLPMAINSDHAILHSTGEYVCFIGDDDGVTIDIIDCVKYMRASGIEALRSSDASYWWPEVGEGRFLKMGGRVSYAKLSSRIKSLNSYQTLIDLLKKGFVNRGQLPLVYHGIVARKVLDVIYRIGGTYFPGSSPDISNGVALSIVDPKYVLYNKIVVFSGASKYHGGGVYLSGKKHPELSDIKWLMPQAVENWDERLPKVGEGEPIWCDSAIKALRYMGKENLEEKINFEYLYLKFALSHKDLFFISLNLTKNKMLFCIKFFIGLIIRYYNGVIELLWGKMNKIPNMESRLGYNDVIEAAGFFHEINIQNRSRE